MGKSFVENIRAQEWYNGDAPRNLSGYLNDKTNRLIGWITMRQVRVQSHPCPSLQYLISTCRDDYRFSNEEKRSFEPGWINQTSQTYSSAILRSFLYQSGETSDTYVSVGDHHTYDAGGYVYEFRGRLSDLRSNLSQLHQLQWLDQQTRAVIIQFNLYNPNVALFTSVTLLVEFLPDGGLYPQSLFQPFSFQRTSLLPLLQKTIFFLFLI